MSQKAKSRTKITGEVFTPTRLVEEMLDKLPIDVFVNLDKTFIDPACGNGQFLIAVAHRRKCIANIFGVDLMVDNVCNTIARLHYFKLGLITNNDTDPFNHTDITDDRIIINYHHNKNEHPEFEWLLTHIKGFISTYEYRNTILTIKPSRYIKNGIIFKCNGELYPTIVCANSLEFFKDGEKNGYDEITDEIEFFNANNSEPITPKITELEIISPVTEEALEEQKVIIPTIKKVKIETKVQKLQNSKIDQKLQALKVELNKMVNKPNKLSSDLKIIELLENQITEVKLQL